MVEATRWLFALLAIVSLFLALLAPLTAADHRMLPVVLVSTLVLGVS